MKKRAYGQGLMLAMLPVLLLVMSRSAWSETVTELTQGMPKSAGLFDLYHDKDKARLLLGIKQFEQGFLFNTSLPYGLGSNDVGLDRGQPGALRLLEFRKVGNKVWLVQPNLRFKARSDNADERLSVTEAFAESVLWAGDILASDQQVSVVDISSFVLTDHTGIAAALKQSQQGEYRVDGARSAPVFERSKSFATNTELEVSLTFSGGNNGEFVQQIAMDPEHLTLRQHFSFLQLPDGDYQPRPYHPFSGGFDVGFYDFATPLADAIDVRYQVRHRLQKTTPGAALSAVKKPIIYYLDRGTPEPVRSALLDGARWWAKGFEQAGFKDAYRVELLPEGVDAMDARYNTILWVHRATRGWSYGSYLADPRTGEIVKGAVTLGSQRVRQDILIAESLLAPYGKPNEAELKAQAEQMALARLRQLAAHEVGHTLGFQHNFAASRQGNGSVMDYPHPQFGFNSDGSAHLNDAYGVGIGPWDEYVVKHAYASFDIGAEAGALSALRSQIQARGLRYLNDADARTAGAAHPDGVLWDVGPDSLASFDSLLKTRRYGLEHFSSAALPPSRQIGELEARLVPLYLLHRYQVEGLAHWLGGVDYRYQLNGEGRPLNTPVDAGLQRQALQRLLTTLSAEQLQLPDSVLALLTPPAAGFERSREYFSTRSAPVFDALAAAEAASLQTAQFLFEPARLNRLAWQQAVDAKQLGMTELLRAVFAKTWQAQPKTAAARAVQTAANWVVLDALLATLDGAKLHAQVDAQVRAQLRQWQQWLAASTGSVDMASSRFAAAEYLRNYLRDGASVKRRALPTIPPGAPI